MQDNKPHILDFGEPEKENSINKVIGVGGGGGNAVNHMYREGIHDVSLWQTSAASYLEWNKRISS